MELIKEQQDNNGMATTWSHNAIGYTQSIVIRASPSNCKLSYIDRTNSFLCGLSNEQAIEAFRAALDKSRQLSFVTVIHEATMKFITKNFNIVYCNKIPYGYGVGYQYHILVSNKEDINARQRHEDAISLVPKPIILKTPEVITSEKIIETIEERKYKTTWGMLNGFKKLLNVR